MSHATPPAPPNLAARALTAACAAYLSLAAASCGNDDASTAKSAVDAQSDGVDDSDAANDAANTDVTAIVAQQRQLPLPGSSHASGFVVAIDGDAMRVALQKTGEPAPRAELQLDRLQLGLVDSYDTGHNYDPALLPDEAPAKLRWATVKTMTAVAKPALAPALDADAFYTLTTSVDGGDSGSAKPGPTMLLRVRRDVARVMLDLLPMDSAAAAAWMLDQDVADSPRIVYLRLVATAPSDEGYYGLGEFMDSPQHRGKRRTTQLTADFNLDGSSNEGHVRVPLLVGSHGWGLFVRSYRAMDFDVAASDPVRLSVTVAHHEAGFELLAADAAIDVVGTYWRSTGAPQLPAPWAVGGLLWRNENKDQAEVLQDAADLRTHDLALSGMWVDRPYDAAVNDFGFDTKLYPNPQAMVATLRASGLHLGLWSTPYLDPGYDNKPKAKHADEAKAKGYFVDGPGAWTKILKWGPPIDFTDPAADAFFRGLIAQYQALGIEGYKLDYGEDIVLGLLGARIPWLFADGSDERTMHRRFFLLYHAAYADHLPKLDGLDGGGFILARAAAWGDQAKTSMIWPGDLCASWHAHGECDVDNKCHAGGLPASIAATISLPTAGLPLFGADTGGYRHGRAPKELFLRWLEHTALSGVLQIGGGSDHNPWISVPVTNKAAPGSVFDAETLDVARRYIRLHARLFPVIWSDLVRAHDSFAGVGPVRALGLMLPTLANDPALRKHEASEHFFGDHLVVAPVITPTAEREVFVPPGVWAGFFDGVVQDGGANGKLLQVQAALDVLPLWVRAGAIVPLLRPTIDTIAKATAAGVDSFGNDPGLLWAKVDLAGLPPRAASDAAGAVTLWDGLQLRCAAAGDGAVELRAVAGAAGAAGKGSGGRVFGQGVVWQVSGFVAAPSKVVRAGKELVKVAAGADVDAAVVACPADCWAVDGSGGLRVKVVFAEDAGALSAVAELR
jgi:alpha-D-xyloside xylohydrolase